MATAYEDLLQITDPNSPKPARLFAMRAFAEKLRWTPHYELTAPVRETSASEHLLVEHGLANSAVITFLEGDNLTGSLSDGQIQNLLTISYNNLVEWHLFVSNTDAIWINNLSNWRSESPVNRIQRFSPSNLTEVFAPERLSDQRSVKRTMRPCDDAIISMVGRWKRLLKADYPASDNHAISTLFNASFFIRGCEDRHLSRGIESPRYLLDEFRKNASNEVNIAALLQEAFNRCEIEGNLGNYIDLNLLKCFENSDRATILDFVSDLYKPRDAGYDLNFALLSKHALSRVYERFVSLLVFDESDDQLSFLNPVPDMARATKTGAIYTPQFVASFFSRYVRDNVTARQFRNIRSLDPACGSGIFLRSLLELQCNPLDPAVSAESLDFAFAHAKGVDRDANAIEATKLSLALLHLVATERLPRTLDLEVKEAISAASEGAIARDGFDAILTNPPYVKLDHLSEQDRETYLKYLGPEFRGRLDAYLAFVKLCVESLSPGGFACFVLPQVMMTADNAKSVRTAITQTCDVRCLVDLSSIRIFDKVGTYSILLIIQKRSGPDWLSGPAFVGHATDFIGEALQAVLDCRQVETPYYRIFEAPQSTFGGERWLLIGPREAELEARLSRLPKLGEYVDWKQGFATGNDRIFIRDRKDVLQAELSIYMDYLPDREIGRYSLPSRTKQVVFYPFIGDNPVDQQELVRKFPQTWAYLSSHERTLKGRHRSDTENWWKPLRPRAPENMRRPKIVCPHLMLTPRFSVDEKGKFAVKRSPFMNVKDKWSEEGVIHYFCALLNSPIAAWYIRTYVPSFDRGYSLVEPKLLAGLPVPRFENVPVSVLERIIELASGAVDDTAESELQDIVVELYGLTANDREVLGA